MTEDDFSVGGIDHVELTVPDRYEAASWYDEALGFEVVEEFEHWAARSAYPLMISSDGGDTMLALFGGNRSGDDGGFRQVAFRADGEEFLQFLDRLRSTPDIDGRGGVMDFESAYSVFFTDPYGHAYEVTTYDYAFVSDELDG